MSFWTNFSSRDKRIVGYATNGDQMTKGAWTLGEYPFPLVRIVCLKCDRSGQHHRTKLIERYGIV